MVVERLMVKPEITNEGKIEAHYAILKPNKTQNYLAIDASK